MSGGFEERLVKVPLPLDLIRRIDGALAQEKGGYTTRQEFFREAAEGLLLELSYAPAPEEPAAPAHQKDVSDEPSATPPSSESAPRGTIPVHASTAPTVAVPLELEATVLRLSGPQNAFTGGEVELDGGTLFGMHNRDYPSIWAAYRLADQLCSGVVSYSAFVDSVTTEAWEYAEALKQIENLSGLKLTALFPTNREKPQSAAEGFRVFAIGSLLNGQGERIRGEGPLFAWRVCQAKRTQSAMLLGITAEGWELLRRLEGISLKLPHSSNLAEAFLSHLRRHAPGDWWGFATVLRAAREKPARVDLVQAFIDGADWSESVAATTAQGYVARAREWGLLEPRMVGGAYELTEFGADYEERAARAADDQTAMGGER